MPLEGTNGVAVAFIGFPSLFMFVLVELPANEDCIEDGF